MKSVTLSLSAMSLIILTSASQAALAPNYQRAKELNAVVDAVAAEFPQNPITKVIYLKEDRYQVIAGPCSVTARIVAKPMKNGMVGPRQFDVKLSGSRCNK